jgi:hypothetical protein
MSLLSYLTHGGCACGHDQKVSIYCCYHIYVSVLNAMGSDNYRSVILAAVNKVLSKNVAALYSKLGRREKFVK